MLLLPLFGWKWESKGRGCSVKTENGCSVKTEKALNIKTSKRCLIINSYLLKNYLHKRLSICCEGVINPVLWSYLVTTYEVLLSYLVTMIELQVNYFLLQNLFYKVFFIYLCTYSNIITAIILNFVRIFHTFPKYKFRIIFFDLFRRIDS